MRRNGLHRREQKRCATVIHTCGEPLRLVDGKQIRAHRLHGPVGNPSSVDKSNEMISNRERLKFAIIFVVNRSDCNLFKANWQGDPVYAKYLNNASDKGIKLYALKINWQNFSCYFDRSLEVDLNKW